MVRNGNRAEFRSNVRTCDETTRKPASLVDTARSFVECRDVEEDASWAGSARVRTRARRRKKSRPSPLPGEVRPQAEAVVEDRRSFGSK